MLFVLAFAFFAIAILALYVFERQKKLRVRSSEEELGAVVGTNVYGGLVAQSYMAKLGVEPDQVTQREDHDFKPFRLDDLPKS